MPSRPPRRCPGRPGCAVALLAAMLSAGCRTRGVRVDPPVVTPKAFSATGTADMPARWWVALGDGRLNALVEESLRGNFSLRQAWDRLRQSRALAVQSGAALWPDLDGSAGGSRTVTRTPATGRTYANARSLGLAAGYEVDLWGRVRSTHDAVRLDAYASAEDLAAAAVTLSAEVAGAWYKLIEQRRQLELLDEQIRTDEKYLEIITLRFSRGRGPGTDVLQQQQLVESVRGDRMLVESSLKVLEHQLAVLLGRAPGGLDAGSSGTLPSLPPLPATGLPAATVRRRPDVQAAELRVQSADRRVAAAIADQFPRLSLSASASTTSERVRDLFDNWLASLAANLTAPLFDGGQRRAEVERTRAVVSERLNAYGEVVLEALQEVEDALAQEAKHAEYVKSLSAQLALAQKSTEQTRDNYAKGTMDFTRYLTTLLAYQRLQRTRLRAQRELVQFRIDLYRALAGDWPLPRVDPARLTGPPAPVAKPVGGTLETDVRRIHI